MKKYLLLLLSIFTSACAGVVTKDLSIYTDSGVVNFSVEIADTVEERAQGLMYRKEMMDDQGMFFIFNESSQLNFWMKNTFIPLDIIFIDENWKIVKIINEAQPCLVENEDDCLRYKSDVEANYVLEIKAGVAEKHLIKEGNKVSLN